MKKFLKIAGIVIGCILLLLAIFAGYAYYKIKHKKDTRDLQVRVDKVCNKYIADGKAAGLFIGIVQGDTVYAQGYGVADKDSKVKPDSNTVFEIGSISKVFTAEIAQLLVTQSMLSWDDGIEKYLPAGVQLPTNDGTTLMHLASHTSGFPRLPQVWFEKLEIDTCNPYSQLDTSDLFAYLRTCTEKKKPSLKSYDYSNFGAGLLGHILEWRTGKSYETLLQKYICGPLRMPNTSTMVMDSAVFATGYDKMGNKTCHWSFPVIAGCGAIRSNGSDMLRFLRANMGNTSAISTEILKTQTEVADMTGGAICYGWHVDKLSGILFGMSKVVWHNGGTGGFRSYIGFVPGSKRGIVLLANQESEDFDDLALELILKTYLTSLK